MVRLAYLVLIAALGGQWLLEIWGHRADDFWVGAAIHTVATLAYFYLCRLVLRGRHTPSFAGALALAVLLRVLVLPLEPALSDDVYRYMHEGSLVGQGENPYLTAPADVPEEFRHPEYWAKINNKDVPAAYPPASQYAMALGVATHPTPLGMKLVFGLFDLLVFVALWSWLPLVGVAASRAVIYGYCPLMVLEFAGEGHSDSLAAFFLVLCLIALARGRRALGAALLAVSTAGKLLPVVFLPFAVRPRWWLVTPFVVVLAGLYAPFFLDGPILRGDRSPLDLFAGTFRFGDDWRANDSVFYVFHAAAERLLEWLQGQGVDAQFVYYPDRVAKIPIALLAVGLLALAWRRRWPMHKVGAALAVFFVSFTPVMHPWYLALFLPFLCVYPNSAWLLFTGTVYLAYHVLPQWRAAQEWEESLGIKITEYVPFYLGLLGVLRPGGKDYLPSESRTKRTM